MPELHVITGSNGAGKSSVGPSFLPPHIRDHIQVFDGDKLFSEKQRDLYLSRQYGAKEMRDIANDFVSDTFAHMVNTAISNKANFAYEGHFTTEETWDIPRRFKEAGYKVHLLFLGLRDTEISKMRVKTRVDEGGHHVPWFDIETNFYGNLSSLNRHHEMIDHLTIMDTSETNPVVLAEFNHGKLKYAISPKHLPTWYSENLPALMNLF